MRPVPIAVDITSFFYPFGNTPAVCLTQELSPDTPADVLLLGCGDVRNVLHTIASNRHNRRPMYFMCCDHEAAIIARNFLLLSMILDGQTGDRTDSLWNIYYHFYLEDNDLKTLQNQAVKLVDASGSMNAWNGSAYAYVLRFHNASTLDSVRRIWKSYSVNEFNRSKWLTAQFKLAKNMLQGSYGGHEETSLNITGIQSASPFAAQAAVDLDDAQKHFWRHGGFYGSHSTSSAPKAANPAIATQLTSTTMLHYGLNPLHGYHLSTAYATSVQGSNTPGSRSDRIGIHKLVQAARAQFHCWAEAFRASRGRVTIDVLVGDVFASCDLLRSIAFSPQAESKPATSSEQAPITFNIIDTSNLADHVGTVNLIVAAGLLLRKSNDATLYTDFLVKKEDTLALSTASALLIDFATAALLLGLFPIEHWSNASMVYPGEAVFANMLETVSPVSQIPSGQAPCRLMWKQQPQIQVAGNFASIHCAEHDLVKLLFDIYLKMFKHENMSEKLSNLITRTTSRQADFKHPTYHRGSFVALLSFLKSRGLSDWSTVTQSVVHLIENDNTLLIGRSYLQELYVQLHLHGLYSAPLLLDRSIALSGVSRGPLLDWVDLPLFLCVTLKVPRAYLRPFTDMKSRPRELGSPLLQTSVSGSTQPSISSWQNLFAIVQISFGTLQTTGRPNTSSHEVTIDIDSESWSGKCPLLASFFVPTWILTLEPNTAKIGLGLQSTLQAAHWVEKLGLSLSIYETAQGNESNVFLSKRPPKLYNSQSDVPISSCLQAPVRMPPAPEAHGSRISIHVNSILRLESLTCRLNVDAGPALDCLREGGKVTIKQRGPFGLRIWIGVSDFDVFFPLPVAQARTGIRIARKSAFVELAARISGPSVSNDETNGLLTVFSCGTSPTLWNVPRLLLNDQPALGMGQDVRWLNYHVFSQLSCKEQTLREQYLKSSVPCPSARVSFKDSLFSIFMHIIGMRVKKHNVFGLTDPEGAATTILIFASKLRLDTSNHTAVIDAAFLYLEDSSVQGLQHLLSFLDLRQLCQIKVGAAELRLWHQLIPVYTERCRTWSHVQGCEYAKTDFHDIEWAVSNNPMCSCGHGVFPDDFEPGPYWKKVKGRCVRAAISPLYPASNTDDLFKGEKVHGPDCCAACGARELSGKVLLLVCGRCKVAKYCSKVCQKEHWSLHKGVCKTAI